MNKGRVKILSDLIPNGEIEHDKSIIPVILKNSISQHNTNKEDIVTLIDYFYNGTDIAIRKKTKTQQPDINNKIGIPYANIAVTTINSYCFSAPFTFSSRKAEDRVQTALKALVDALDDDKFSQKTSSAEMKSGMCGLGYKYIRPATLAEQKQNKWFETSAELDPEKTFCVYANDLMKKKILAVTFYEYTKYDAKGNPLKTVTRYNCWTKYHYWIFDNEDGEYKVVPQDVLGVQQFAYPLGYEMIPIVEFPRKADRTSDFEIAIDLINSGNNLISSRVDDVQQATDYLLLFRDIDTDNEDSKKGIADALKQGILSFKSVQNATVQPEIKVLNVTQNQTQVQTLQDFIGHKIEEALNIPNRENRGSGGDTGTAVENRAGFRSLENIAGLVTSSAIVAEAECLEIILAICKNFENCPFKDLTINDIEIKDNRNKMENLTNSTNAYSTLRSAGMNDLTALEITRIVPDARSVSDLNKKELKEAESVDPAIPKDNSSTQTNNGSNSDNAVE